MIILGIETSCDETASAIVKDGTKIISNVVASSSDIHSKTGGIIPEQAARQQVISIIPVIKLSLKEAKLTKGNIDAIAVTYGPGLIGSLLVGVETAKTLSFVWKKPIIPVNHLAGHVYANWIADKNLTVKNRKPRFPAIALVVSGGHTDLVAIKRHGSFEWISGTRDDAAGEAFDKTARLLDLPYPGGPSISLLAEKYIKQNPHQELTLFPRPLMQKDTYDWSFSGLKTAVFRYVQNNKEGYTKERIAAEIQESIADVLVFKTLRVVEKFKPKSLLLAGGVASNNRLKNKFVEKIKQLSFKVNLFIPEPNLCTDNAVYIASYAYFNHKPAHWKQIAANPELTIAEVKYPNK